VQRAGATTLNEGQRVEYNTEEDRRGVKAIDLVLGGN
jgi:cold shock CspA family protein